MAGLIEHQGVVRQIIGDQVQVQVSLKGCGSCEHGSSCGMGKLTPKKDNTTLLMVEWVAGVHVGDVVTLGLQESRISLYALLGYFVPAFAFVLGALLGNVFFATDGATALGAITAMSLSLLLIRLTKRFFPTQFPMPHIVT